MNLPLISDKQQEFLDALADDENVYSFEITTAYDLDENNDRGYKWSIHLSFPNNHFMTMSAVTIVECIEKLVEELRAAGSWEDIIAKTYEDD